MVFFVTSDYLFGVHSAPAICQRAMEGLFKGIPSTVVYIDNILVTGSTEEEHLQIWRPCCRGLEGRSAHSQEREMPIRDERS